MTAARVTFPRIAPAGTAHGDRGCHISIPALYGIVVNGEMVGRVRGRNRGYMGASEWRVEKLDCSRLFLAKSLGTAKAMIRRRVGEYGGITCHACPGADTLVCVLACKAVTP